MGKGTAQPVTVKTQVIHLEAYDDRHSIIDRLNWGQADRIILIWPLRGAPLDSKLDLKLIHRRCQSAGMELGLVCKKRQVKDFAFDLGIAVFRSLRQAQQTAWDNSQSPDREIEPPPKKHTREELAEMIQRSKPPGWTQKKSTRWVAFTISMLAVVTLAVFLIPGARIEYLPPSETQSLLLTLTADPEIDVFNLSGAIPTERLSITVEGRAETESTGETGIPDQHATGIIVLTNLTDQEIEVPDGTVIRTADPNTTIRFVTSIRATIDAESGATARIPIEAVNPGSSANLPADTLVILEGDLSRSITATNPQPTLGGSEQISPSPSSKDYEALSQQLLSSLWKTALEEAEQLLDEKDIILDSNPRSVIILEESFSPPEPQPSSVLTLLLRVEYEILAIRWEDLEAMGNATLDVTLPPGYAAQQETFELEPISEPQFGEDDLVTWETVLNRQIFKLEELQQTVRRVLGKQPDEAQKIIQSELNLREKPEITLFPQWWPILPLTEFRVEAIDLFQE